RTGGARPLRSRLDPRFAAVRRAAAAHGPGPRARRATRRRVRRRTDGRSGQRLLGRRHGGADGPGGRGLRGRPGHPRSGRRRSGGSGGRADGRQRPGHARKHLCIGARRDAGRGARMIGAALRGLVAARASWWAPALVAALVSTMIGICLVQAVGTDASSPAIQEVLRREGLSSDYVSSIGAGIAMMILPVAVIVLATVSSAAVGTLTLDLARWRLAGASGPLLAVLVMGQLCVVALAGGAAGTVATVLVGGRLATLLNQALLPELAGLAVTPTPSALWGALVIPPATALVAGVLPAIRAARVPALRAVRRDEEAVGRVGLR